VYYAFLSNQSILPFKTLTPGVVISFRPQITAQKEILLTAAKVFSALFRVFSWDVLHSIHVFPPHFIGVLSALVPDISLYLVPLPPRSFLPPSTPVEDRLKSSDPFFSILIRLPARRMFRGFERSQACIPLPNLNQGCLGSVPILFRQVMLGVLLSSCNALRANSLCSFWSFKVIAMALFSFSFLRRWRCDQNVDSSRPGTRESSLSLSDVHGVPDFLSFFQLMAKPRCLWSCKAEFIFPP